MDECVSKGLDFIKEIVTQLIAIAIGLLTISTTFSEKFLSGIRKTKLILFLVKLSWVSYIISMIFGGFVLMKLTGTLFNGSFTPDDSATGLYLIGQMLFFVLAISITFYLGIKVLNSFLSNSSSNSLVGKGWFLLKDKSEGELKNILELLGNTIYTTDVFVKPGAHALVTSDKALDFHSDHHDAKYVVWYCLKQTNEGGETLLIDAEGIYKKLTMQEQNEISKVRFFEHKVFPDDEESAPFITRIANQNRFYYSFWPVNPDDKQNKGLVKFENELKNCEYITLKLEPKDILIVNNHRILHGRTEIKGNKDRFLKRFWIS